MPAQNAMRMRDDLVDLEPSYGACVQEVILSANENPFGVPRALREVMNEAVAQSAFNRCTGTLWRMPCARISLLGMAFRAIA